MSVVVGKIKDLTPTNETKGEKVLRDMDSSAIGVEAKGNGKQSILLSKEEIRLIERIRQLCRRPKDHLVIVKPDCFLSWYVTGDREF